MKQTSVKIPEPLLDKLDKDAERQGRSRAELIRTKLGQEYYD